MAALLTLASCVVGLLAAIGVGLGLVLLFFPELKKWPANFIQQHLFPDANQILLNQGKATANGAQRNVYRVLAFGDSLTEGFTSGGVNFHPYVKRLGDKLYAGMPQGWHLEVEEQGESGERVLISMKHRLQRTLDEHAAAGRHYDWVLLLGGINDLGGDQSTAEEVLQGLAVLTEACLTHGANVLLMTVMEVAQPEPAIEKQRQQLNTLIQQYAQGSKWTAAAQAALQSPGTDGNSSSSSSRSPVARRGPPRVVLYDLARELTWSEMSEEQRWENWDDGVHLTVDGYDLMGELISAALRPLVVQEIGKAAGGGSVHGSAAVVANDGPGRGMHGQSNGITEHKKSL